MIDNTKLFCLHHKDAFFRKNRLIKVFQYHNLDVEWVEKFHPQEINKSELNIQNNKLNIAEISLYLKHKWCLEQLDKNDWPGIIIFEDDIVLPAEWDIKKYLTQVINEFEKLQGDIAFIGGAFNIKPSRIEKDKLVYCEPGFVSRCTHSLLVNKKCINKILKSINILNDAIDWKYTKIINEEKLRCCYVEPSLQQLTVEGYEKSLIQL